jgi:hypothetical protein
MENTKAEKKVPVLVLVPSKTAAYLDGEAAKIEKRYGCRSGKACIMRGLADAMEVAQFPIADIGATNFHLTAALVEALRAYNKTAEVK